MRVIVEKPTASNETNPGAPGLKKPKKRSLCIALFLLLSM